MPEVCFPASSSSTTTLPDIQYERLPGGDDVQVRPAQCEPWAKLGMFEVSINGQVQHMTREEVERTNFNRCTMTPASAVDPTVAAALEGRRTVGSIGPLLVAVPNTPGSAATTAVPADPMGSSKVLAASADPMATASAIEMANRTGHQITGLHKGALAGASEVTLVTHGAAGKMELNGGVVTPRQVARALVDAGWQGGTVRLAACDSGAGGAQSFAQQLANELSTLKAESGVIGARGPVGVLGDNHGLPQVATKASATQPAGQGWDPVVTAQPKPSMLARGAAMAGVGVNVLAAVGTIKLAWDFKEMMEFGDAVRSGKFFNDFWSEVSSYPHGTRIELGGQVGVLDKSDGVSLRFKDDNSDLTMRMTTDPKAGLGYHLSGTQDGVGYDYQVDKTGVRGKETIQI